MNGDVVLEKNKIDGGKFDTVLIILFIIGWFTIGLLFSSIGCIIIYLIFRKSIHYPDKKIKKNKKKP